MNSVSFYIPDNLDLKSLLSIQYPKMVKHIDKFYYVINKLYVTKFLDKRYTNATPILPYSLPQSSVSNPIIYSNSIYNINIIKDTAPATTTPYDVTFLGLPPSAHPPLMSCSHFTKFSQNTNQPRIYSSLSSQGKKAGKKLYIQLNISNLRKILTTRFSSKIINILIELGIIETDGQYIPSKKSKGYRLNESYHNQHFLKVSVVNTIFEQKLVKLQQNHILALTPHHQQMFNLLGEFHLDEKHIELLDCSQGITTNQLLSVRLACDKIRRKDYYFSTDSKTGRIFHNFSNIKKEYRKCILDSEDLPLVDIDISNSQPFFLSLILIANNICGNDVELYHELTKQGKLYDYIADKCNQNRSYVKDKIIIMLFGKNEWEFLVKKCFIEQFPNVYAVIERYKENNQNELALELQRREADFMINTLSPILIEKNIKFLTVHDSLMVSQKDAYYVHNMMKDTFIDYCGVTPTLKMTDLQQN